MGGSSSLARRACEERPALLIFADDWGRHPSSCQHLARHLLADYEVWWINTIGTRRPGLNGAALRRGREKLWRWLGASRFDEELSVGLHVVDPPMWPWFARPHDRWLNRQLLTRRLRPLVAALPGPVSAVTTVPLLADLASRLPAMRWIYYCVDDLAAWPGLDRPTLERMERRLLAQVDAVVAAGEPLRARLAALGRAARVVTHGVDVGHWRSSDEKPLPALARFEHPLVVFWGLIDRRLDAGWIRRLASDMERGTVLLVGPLDAPPAGLFDPPRVARLPPLAYDDLPRLAAEAAVLVMPYQETVP